MKSFVISKRDAGTRVDRFIEKTFESVPKSLMYKEIRKKNIKVNKKRCTNDQKLNEGDLLELYLKDDVLKLKVKHLDFMKASDELDIVYEDEDVIVVNKPTGRIVHPSAGICSGTLVNALLYHCHDLSAINGITRPGIVHRIDKETSGLIMVEKNDNAHRSLSKQLEEHSVVGRYVALVHGVINHNVGRIEAPIGRDSKDRKKMAVTSKNAKDAITNFKVLERYDDMTLIECRLETGRTHQIRVHMQYIGHPVYGDPQYGFRNDDNTHGQYLHAKVLGFVHPRTNEHMYFEAPLPDFFEEKINELGGEYNG